MSLFSCLGGSSRWLRRVHHEVMQSIPKPAVPPAVKSTNDADLMFLEELPWHAVVEVDVYIQDCLVIDQLCFVLVIDEPVRVTIEVNEDDLTFAELASEIPIRLSGAMTERQWLKP